MSTLAIVDDWIEFEGRRVARLESGLPPTLVYRLEETLAEIDEDEDEDELDEEIERLIRAMAEAGRPQSLTARMRRARMRLVAAAPTNPKEPS
jgi:hypothetical protein